MRTSRRITDRDSVRYDGEDTAGPSGKPAVTGPSPEKQMAAASSPARRRWRPRRENAVAAAVILVLAMGFVIIVPGPYATIPTCADILRPALLHRIPGVGPDAHIPQPQAAQPHAEDFAQHHPEEFDLDDLPEVLTCEAFGDDPSSRGRLAVTLVRYSVALAQADDASEAVERNRGAHYATHLRPVALGDGGYASAADRDRRDKPDPLRYDALLEFSERNMHVLVGYRHPSDDGADASTSSPQDKIDVVLEVGRAVLIELDSTWTWF